MVDIAQINELVREVQMFAPIFGSRLHITAVALHSVLAEAFAYASGEFSIRAAQEWAQGFTFPPHLLANDTATFAANDFDLVRVCQQRHAEHAADRISIQRVHHTFGPTGTRSQASLQMTSSGYARWLLRA
jgi:hypothetical protein